MSEANVHSPQGEVDNTIEVEEAVKGGVMLLRGLVSRKDGSAKKVDSYEINPRIIEEEEGFNLRNYNDPDVIAQIEDLAQSYMAGAFVPPIIFRTTADGKIVPIDGHQRVRAAKIAIERGAPLPFISGVYFNGNNVERTKLMLRAEKGLKYKPLEQGIGYLRLYRMKLTVEEIAKDVGRSTTHVETMLMLANADADVHELLLSGKVSAEAALAAIRKYGENAGQALKAKLNGGVERVTAKVMDTSPRLPKKVATSVVTHFRQAASLFTEHADLRRHVEQAGSTAALRGQTVSVDAEKFYALMQAHDEIVKATSAKGGKDAKATKAAAKKD